MQNDFGSLALVPEREDKDSPSVPSLEQDLIPAPSKSAIEPLKNAKRRATMRQMMHKEAKRIHTTRVKDLLLKAVEEALLDTFHIGFESTNEGLESTYFRYVKQIVMKMNRMLH